MSFYPVQAQNFKLQGAGVAIGATTCKLVSFTQINGTLLTMTDFGAKGYLTIEPGVTNEEQISFTGVTQNADGTATLTGVSTVGMVNPFTETSGFAKIHVGGTIGVLSNTAGFYEQFATKANQESITGTWTFAVASWPRVDNSATLPTQDAYLATKKYVDGVAIAGSPVAGTGTLGIAKLSTAAVTATSPIVVGDNDTRVPTQGENDALVGTRGTPSSSNKFVTNDDTSTTGTTQYVARYSGTGLLTVASTPTNTTDATSKSYVDGQTYVSRVIIGTTAAIGGIVTGTTVTTVATHNLGKYPRMIAINTSAYAGGDGANVYEWGEIVYAVDSNGTPTATGGITWQRQGSSGAADLSYITGANRTLSVNGNGTNKSSINISVTAVGTTTFTITTTTATIGGSGRNSNADAVSWWALP